MDTAPAGNESELQSRLVETLRAALPLLPASIRLERYLNLRLGHRALTIDGAPFEPGVVHGRYDVLVLLDDAPLILAELKADTQDVTEDDVAQALSYARLHQPMVPLVFVTNSKTSHLRQTIDGAELDPTSFGTKQLEAALGAASALAAKAVEQAIRTLLGASNKLWGRLLAAWTEEALSRLSGDVRDFSRPVPRGFVIPRRATQEVCGRFDSGTRVVVVRGPALSGVTNSLAQYAAGRHAALLVETRSVPDVIQFMANRLTRELAFPVSKDDLRGWLNARSGLHELTLVIDGFPREGVEELIEFANAGLLRLVFGMDSADYENASLLEGRRLLSPLGRTAEVVELHPLSDAEFEEARDVLHRSFGALLHSGAEFVPDLRFPRKLRVLVSGLPPEVRDRPKDGDTVIVIPPIPGPERLRAFGRAILSNPEDKHDARKLAEAYLDDVAEHVGDPDWVASTWARPSIDPNRVQQSLGQDRIDRLRKLGFVSWVDVPRLGPRLLARVEELLACYVADTWADRLARTKDEDLAGEIDRLLRLTMLVPTGEVALALAIFLAVERSHPTFLGTVVSHLALKQPTESVLSEGSRVYLLVKDARISVEFGEGVSEKAIGGLEAWLVLSHLAALNMVASGCDATVNFSIFLELGAAPYLIVNPRPIEPNLAAGYHFHEFHGVGSVLCFSTGIVEPLVQSMLSHASQFPGEFVLLAREAMRRRAFHLAWRLMTVASIASTISDDGVAAAARQVEEVLREWWRQFLDDYVRQHSRPPEAERE